MQGDVVFEMTCNSHCAIQIRPFVNTCSHALIHTVEGVAVINGYEYCYNCYINNMCRALDLASTCTVRHQLLYSYHYCQAFTGYWTRTSAWIKPCNEGALRGSLPVESTTQSKWHLEWQSSRQGDLSIVSKISGAPPQEGRLDSQHRKGWSISSIDTLHSQCCLTPQDYIIPRQLVNTYRSIWNNEAAAFSSTCVPQILSYFMWARWESTVPERT